MIAVTMGCAPPTTVDSAATVKLVRWMWPEHIGFLEDGHRWTAYRLLTPQRWVACPEIQAPPQRCLAEEESEVLHIQGKDSQKYLWPSFGLWLELTPVFAPSTASAKPPHSEVHVSQTHPRPLPQTHPAPLFRSAAAAESTTIPKKSKKPFVASSEIICKKAPRK